MKLSDIFGKQLGPLSLGGWISLCFVITVSGVIRSYVWPEMTNGRYLQELIETGTVQKTATVYVATIKNANTAPTPSEADWAQIEKGLSECLVKQANNFLASGDSYLRLRADKSTPLFLAKRFLDACGATGSEVPPPTLEPWQTGTPLAQVAIPQTTSLPVVESANVSRAATPQSDFEPWMNGIPVVESANVPRPGADSTPPESRGDTQLGPPLTTSTTGSRKVSGVRENIPTISIRGATTDEIKLAGQGNAVAQYSVAMRYTLSAAPDHKQAAFWFEKAATQGHVPSQYEIGAMYYQGEGVAKDYRQAAFWFQKAAEQGDQGGQYDSGLMFYRGEGVAQDYVEAHKWWNLAGRSGDRKARDRREMVEQLMTREQIAEAQRRASEWLKTHK